MAASKMSYSDAELEHALADLESDLIERKETLAGDAPTTVREAICAFANDLPDHRKAGIVFVGARNNGTLTGLTVTDELTLTLAAMKTDGNILPPPTLTVEKRKLMGTDVAVVTVTPSDAPPVSFRGRIWIRIGPRRAIATAQDERILNEKRRFRDRTFDAHPVASASLADLSRTRFEQEYLPAAVAPDVLAANERTYEQRLAAAKMIVSPDDPIPTVAGLLVLGTRLADYLPGAYVQFLRINGTALSDPIRDDAAISGDVPAAVEIRRRLG